MLTLIKYLVMSRPAMSSRLVRCGRAKPSYTGQICVTPSPESTTTPVRRPGKQHHDREQEAMRSVSADGAKWLMILSQSVCMFVL